MNKSSCFFTLFAISAGICVASVEYPGANPGVAKAMKSNATYTVSNDLLSADFTWDGDGVSFGGFKAADGTVLVNGGGPVFRIIMADKRELSSTDMVAEAPKITGLKGDASSLTISKQLPGKAISTTFNSPNKDFAVEWRAVLRDGSHYLRQEYTIKSTGEPVYFNTITPLQVLPTEAGGTPSISGNTTNGTVVVTDKLFMGLETPMSVMSVGQEKSGQEDSWNAKAWSPQMFGSVFNMPESFESVYGKKFAAKNGPILQDLLVAEGPVNFKEPGKLEVDFKYERGNNRLNIVAVQLVSASGQVIDEDVHPGYTGQKSEGAKYYVNVRKADTYHLRYWIEKKTEPITSSGSISLSLAMGSLEDEKKEVPDNIVTGSWVRKTKLMPGSSWKVNSVIGLFAPEQQRRSFLSYIEREKPVPYRTMVHYNDWYEVGIVRHDNTDPLERTTEAISMNIAKTWKREMFEKRKTKIDAFVIDDGWDDFNSLWDFHAGFPQGFANLNKLVTSMGCGMGTWLGPVGGYGSSKNQRISYWNRTHPENRISNFELSNPIYFDAFVGRCKDMVKKYDMRYFKFDGISTKPIAYGPAGFEDAEGILSVLAALRQARPDIFINTTVGTWASPFWFMHADSIWRQEGDFDQIGNMGDARDRWITYRDRLVHEIFVTGAPLFPINSIMIHGTIITKNGPPRVMSKSPDNCIKEMRTAFTSGSALQEMYVDADLMNQQGGVLWDELARCIAWIRRNADVLADVHWVGGNPWDKKKQDGDIYGWASWNKKKCTLSLRNSSKYQKTLKGTLRSILDIPPHIKGSVVLRSSFKDQTKLPIMDTPIDVDAPIEIVLSPFDIVTMEGICKMK